MGINISELNGGFYFISNKEKGIVASVNEVENEWDTKVIGNQKHMHLDKCDFRTIEDVRDFIFTEVKF